MGARFTLDVFASSSNTKCKIFFSTLPSKGAAGVNAFTQDWSGQTLWICPPVNHIIAVFRHLQATRAEGVLVVPNWKHAIFWPVLTIDGETFHPMFYKRHEFLPWFIKGKFCSKNLFDGRPNFAMWALFFRT